MANTVTQSTEKAKALMSGHKYLYGGKGQKYTSALVNKLAKAYPSTYTASLKAEALKDADKGYIAGDCSWFVCTVLGITQMGSSQIKGKAVKLLPINKANAKEGMAIWKNGHIAYIGDGLKIYEARSTTKDFTVSSWDNRANDFTYMFVVKGTGLDVSNTATTQSTTVQQNTTSKYYRACASSHTSITMALASVGEANTSYANRKRIAVANGIAKYSGSASQNMTMLKLLKAGKLIKA